MSSAEDASQHASGRAAPAPRAAAGAPSRPAWPRPTATEYVCLLAGGYLCLAYAWLLDDAFVYFKYIDNWLLLDRGLVYNPGEYAEGYTSPAWLLLLAGLRSLGLGYWLVARAVALVAFACFWLGCVVIHRRLAPAGVPTLNLPLVILCVNYAVLCYFSSGTEAPLVQLSAVAYGLLLLYPAWLPGQLAVGISPLVRPELALAWLLVVAWLAWQRRPAAWRVMVIGVAAGGAWLVFRVLYYADVFPTTFYLKAGSDPGQGWRYLHDTLAPYHLYAWIALGLAGLFAVRRRRAESSPLTQARLGMLGAAAAIALYVVWIGGDARHYRYLAFPVCLALLAFGGLAEHAMRMRGIRPSPAAHTLLGLAVALGSAALYPRQLAAHPVREAAVRGVPALGQAAIVDDIADAAMHRFHPELEYLSPWGDGSAIEMRPRYQSWRAAGGGDTPTRVSASPICWSHYQHFDEWSIHRFGLTDGVLARMRVRSSPEDRPGHKIALRKPARELAAILEWWSRPPSRGMYRAAVDAGVARQWVRDNLATLELLERKLYGPRTAWESAKLAAHFRERIDLDGSR